MDLHRVSHIFVPLQPALFGHPAIAHARSTGRPIACFNRASGSFDAKAADLVFPPEIESEKLAEILLDWFDQTVMIPKANVDA